MVMAEKLDAVLSDSVARFDVPGVAAAVTGRDGLLYEAGYGVCQTGTTKAMTPDTIVWIASMTKAVTGVAVMQCVEQGLLDLDVPAAEVIPYLGRVPVLEGFDEIGQPKLRAANGTITLRRLLTHTAGFGYETWHEPIQRYSTLIGLPPRASGRKAAIKTPLMFDPGERWEYSVAIDWVGLMVEAVSGLNLGEYMRRNIFAPIGMSSTGFKLDDAMRARRATIHQREDHGGLTPLPEFEFVQEPDYEAGGGGLYSTVRDYAAFTRMILNEGESPGGRILEAGTVETMSANQMGDCRVVELRTCDEKRSLDAELFPDLPKTWGLTFMINEEDAPTGRPAGSLGWAGLSNCYFWIDPVNGLSGVYATQVLPFMDTKSLRLYLDLETVVYGSL
ncbi:MAG: 1,4-butanediol diacrylate esterase [Rhodospirillaceae bacterium]|nr:1,4-butanediol diacrylate esterase [Rhodospirillaceae bacterium]